MKTCEICGGTVSSETTNTICSYCISARESTTASKDSKDSLTPHICGCINADRKNCPICKKPCHHDTSLSPKILISPM